MRTLRRGTPELTAILKRLRAEQVGAVAMVAVQGLLGDMLS